MEATYATVPNQTHAGPPLWLLAILFTVFFLAGLYPVTAFAGKPYWPGPLEAPEVIVPYFQTHSTAVLTCLFLHVGAAICLGLLTAATVSRMFFLGVRSAGPWIALFGGLLTAFNIFAGSLILWVMIHPGVAGQPSVLLALYYLSYAFGGPGFSMPLGILMAGISIPAAFMRLLPKWVIILGLALAVTGELSWLHLIRPSLLFLIPLTRFPGFVWLIAAGFALPKTARSPKGDPEIAT
jgi:hypothetical protein